MVATLEGRSSFLVEEEIVLHWVYIIVVNVTIVELCSHSYLIIISIDIFLRI